MLPHSLGGTVIYISLQHFIAPPLDLMPCLQSRGTLDCNKGIKIKTGAIMKHGQDSRLVIGVWRSSTLDHVYTNDETIVGNLRSIEDLFFSKQGS